MTPSRRPTTAPAARLAAILTLLHDAPGYLLPSQDLWEAIPDYAMGGESGRRKYRRDLRALVSRGLIQTDLSTQRTPNRTGVRLRFIGKPTDWELTAAEHRALRLARKRHRTPLPPATEGRDSNARLLDIAMDALRILEEQGSSMTGAQLASELGVSPEDVVTSLSELDLLDIDGRSAFEGLLLVDYYDDETDEPLPSEEVEFSAHRARSPDHPLKGFGLDALGRFAYTTEEAADRLRLIALELERDTPETDTAALLSARGKLERWVAHLASSGSATTAAS